MQALLRSLPLLPPLVVFGLMGAGAMLIPAGYASAGDMPHLAWAFVQSALISAVVLILLALATARRPGPGTSRSMLLTMAGSYAILPIMLALPLAMALPDTGLFNAWWEMVSSLTTTGASLYDADRLAEPLHLWRGLVGWMGGLHILVAAIAIMAPLHIGGFEIMTTPYRRDPFYRLPGGMGQQIPQAHIAPDHAGRGLDLPIRRLYRAFLAVFPVYAGLTLVLWLLLLIAGDPGLVALMRALGTISTSGIAPVTRPVGAASGFWGEAVVLIFLIPALSRRFWPGGGELIATERLRDDPELRMAAGLAMLVALILFFRHFIAEAEITPDQISGTMQGPKGALAAAWGGFFTALSFLTTTGWTSLDWTHARFWSGLTSPGLILAGLAMMGGGVATAAGGVKLLRIHALTRQSIRELERIFHPSSVAGGGRAARRLRREGAYLAFIAFALFAVSIAVVVMLVSIQRVSFDSATILSVAALSNTGQLTGSIPLMPVFEGSAGFAGAPWEGWAGLPGFTKLVLAGAMIIGRIETLAILALMSPDLWRR